MSAKQIVVLGGGFAGLWSAVGAARKLDELRYGPETAEVTVVNRDGYHGIRVRNYESDLSEVRVPLDDVLGPVGIRRVEGEVAGIDLANQAVTVTTAGGQRTLPYDRLVFALGSQLLRPNVPGVAEHGFDVECLDLVVDPVERRKVRKVVEAARACRQRQALKNGVQDRSRNGGLR